MTGLDYAMNRHYDSQQGRFTQVDPVEMWAVSLGDPQSLNLYSYVGNDSVNRIDPDGLFWGKLFRAIGKAFRWIGVAVSVALIVVGVSLIGTPFLGGLAIAMIISGGLGLASQFAPRPVKIVIGLAAAFLGIPVGGIDTLLGFAPFGNGTTESGEGSIFSRLVGLGALILHFDKKKKKKYKTAQQAAIAILKEINARSISINKEIAGFICKNKDGTYIPSTPQVIGSHGGGININCPNNTQLAGIYHTHAAHDPNLVSQSGNGNEVFSRLGDMSAANGLNVPNWMSSPSGHIYRYDPVGPGLPDGRSSDVSSLYGRASIRRGGKKR